MIILVTGIPGVGKTTLIQQFIHTHRDFTYISGSALSQTTPAHWASSDVSLESSQHRIARILRRYASRGAGKAILDGHLILGTSEGWYEIPQKIFSQLSLRGIVVVVDSPEAILERRLTDRKKLRPYESATTIAAMQNAEISYARQLAAADGVPLRLVEATGFSIFEKEILQITGTHHY